MRRNRYDVGIDRTGEPTGHDLLAEPDRVGPPWHAGRVTAAIFGATTYHRTRSDTDWHRSAPAPRTGTWPHTASERQPRGLLVDRGRASAVPPTREEACDTEQSQTHSTSANSSGGVVDAAGQVVVGQETVVGIGHPFVSWTRQVQVLVSGAIERVEDLVGLVVDGLISRPLHASPIMSGCRWGHVRRGPPPGCALRELAAEMRRLEQDRLVGQIALGGAT